MVDYDEIIRVCRQAIRDTSKDRVLDQLYLLETLGSALDSRFQEKRALSDLEEAIEATRQAIDQSPQDYRHRMTLLSDLGARLRTRYSTTGEMRDLEEAIQVGRQAIGTITKYHSERARQLNNLGVALGDRYELTGAIEDLEESLQILHQAVEILPLGYQERLRWLGNLAAQLGRRYLRTGAMADLEEAIRRGRQAIDVDSPDHLLRGRALNNLGVQLVNRYERTGAMTDLDEAIHMARQAININSKGLHQAYWLNNLGDRLALRCLSNRHSRAEAMADLNEAIQVTRQAIDIIPEGHSERARLLNNLGARLGDRYSITKGTGGEAAADLTESICAARQAISMIPKNHLNRARSLNNLGVGLYERYLSNKASTTQGMSDLEEAIQLGQQAVDMTPSDHPERVDWLNSLGFRLHEKYKRTGVMADLNVANNCFKLALYQTDSLITERLKAGAAALMCSAEASDWEEAFRVSDVAIQLIPKLSSRSLQNSDKQYALGRIVGLASDAAAAALHAGESPSVALNLLEQGRGVLAASIEEMRTDILDLQQKHPELAERFASVRDELEVSIASDDLLVSQNSSLLEQTHGDRRHQLGIELDKLIEETRKRHGFQNFLKGPSEDQIKTAARYGPVVVVNVSVHRCDAILVERDRISCLLLPLLKLQDVKDRVTEGRLWSLETLEWLWTTVANPILAALGFNTSADNSNAPHIWWIPTGPLCKFPLHAAGYHTKRSAETVLDCAMSSYSSSIKAILHGRRPEMLATALGPLYALLVAMRQTPQQTELQFADEEVEQVSEVCRSMGLQPVQPRKKKQDVSSYLQECKIFHFAGHGRTDLIDPSQSCLLLEDWNHNPLTVATLFRLNLRQRSPFLAYLSACGTGQIKDGRFLDESIHLISACQLAGFRHVVGTLWEVNDQSCVDMARATYKEIKVGAMTDESVCRGLHHATVELRNRWLSEVINDESRDKSRLTDKPTAARAQPEIGSEQSNLPRDVVVCDDDDDDDNDGRESTKPLYWIPYVHFGV